MTITIIAEAGSSPAAGDWDFGRWARSAQSAGATALKCQMFHADHFPKAEQASKRALEFPRERLREFVLAAHDCGLQAGVSVFDTDGAALAGRQCDFLKLAAREQDNEQLIEACYYEPNELGLRMSRRKPIYRSISRFELSEWSCYHNWTTLMTTQSYPTSTVTACLRVLRAASFFKRYYVRRWGWSSHTRGTFDVLLAVRLGATVIEKHLAITPDDIEAGHSLSVDQFHRMTFAIRKYERN